MTYEHLINVVLIRVLIHAETYLWAMHEERYRIFENAVPKRTHPTKNLQNETD